MAPGDLQRADRLLLRAIDEEMETATRKAGEWLVCRPGCTDCCIGPFPITRLDAWRLRQGLARLEESDPDRAAALRERTARAVEALRDDFPGDPASGTLSGDREQEDRFFDRHGSLPCPALDPEAGTCDLYDSRPVSCRTYGPPVRFGEQSLPPCRLCFDGATPEEIERCRVTPDDSGIEAALLERLRRDDDGKGETIIPFALLGAPEEKE
jgi:Fe-S-cluster containining protein